MLSDLLSVDSIQYSISMSQKNETCAERTSTSARKRHVVGNVILIASVLIISSKYMYNEKRTSETLLTIQNKLLRKSSRKRDDVIKEIDAHEERPIFSTAVINSDNDPISSFEEAKVPVVVDKNSEWPGFDEEEFERRLNAIPEYDDERALLAIPMKSSCPTYSKPRPINSKKGFAATFRPSGELGSYAQNVPRTRTMNVGWNYSWNHDRIPQQPPNIEFVPMVWSGSSSGANFKLNLQQHVVPDIKKGLVHRVLGFNEPDAVEQSNMSVFQALARWPALESLNVPLASPSCVKPDGEWMEEFMARAKQLCLRVDYIGVHWYSSPNFASFQAYMTKTYNKYQKPLIITEFAVADWAAQTVQQNRHSQAEVLEFMKEALPWLERTPWIAGYAWFSFQQSRAVGTSSALFDSRGELTTVGRYYQSVRKDRRKGDQSITIFDF